MEIPAPWKIKRISSPRLVSELCYPQYREDTSAHDHHRKKIIWGTFLTSKKTFQISGAYKILMKTRKTISTTEIFPLWPPFFFSAKKTSALEQGGVCFLFHSSTVGAVLFFWGGEAPLHGTARAGHEILNSTGGPSDAPNYKVGIGNPEIKSQIIQVGKCNKEIS